MWPIAVSDTLAFFNQSRQSLDIVGGPASETNATATDLHYLTTDSRTAHSGSLFVPIRGERFDGHDFLADVAEQGCTLSLCDKNWYEQLDANQKATLAGMQLVLTADVLALFRDFAAWFRQRLAKAGIPIIGVGGSNGKTTTKEILHFLLGGAGNGIEATDKSENGYLGIAKTLTKQALTSQSSPGSPHSKLLIAEIGIDNLGAMVEHQTLVKPEIALITSLAEEHLEGLINFENVVTEELKLMQPSSVRIWQWNDAEIRAAAQAKMTTKDWVTAVISHEADNGDTARQLTDFLKKNPDLTKDNAPNLLLVVAQNTHATANPQLAAWTRSSGFSTQADWHCLDNAISFPLPGEHNLCNLSTALGAALATTGLEKSPIAQETLQQQLLKMDQFQNADYRSVLKKLDSGNTLFIDCYNANPASVAASLEVLKRAPLNSFNKFIFLGDMLDLGPNAAQQHENLLDILQPLEQCHLFLYGPQMTALAQKITTSGVSNPKLIAHSDNDFTALETAATNAFNALPDGHAPVAALLKASRGMKLEALIGPLTKLLA